MAKKKPPATETKNKFTADYVPFSRPLPDAIESLRDTRIHDDAAAAWRAASLLFDCLEFWWAWVCDWRKNGDADMAVPEMLSSYCYPSIHTLANFRVSTLNFQQKDAKEIHDMLPLIPDFPWKICSELMNDTEKRLVELVDVKRECSQLMDMLEQTPQLALGEYVGTPTDSKTLSPHDKEEAERNRWLYEKWQEGNTWEGTLTAQEKAEGWKKEWWRLESISGVRDAVKRHAEASDLPVPKGKGGRPKTIV